VRTALTRIVNWGHALLAEVTGSGQLVVDLTAGNGHDTLMLWRLVAADGQVIAFDLQPEALQSTRRRLQENGVPVRLGGNDDRLPQLPGVDLIAAGHEHLQCYLPAAPQAIIANLGYLPGGDEALITQPRTTLLALQQALTALAPGGRLAVVVYPGHPGGALEAEAVDGLFAKLEQGRFEVLQLKVVNRPEAPYLQVAEKRK